MIDIYSINIRSLRKTEDQYELMNIISELKYKKENNNKKNRK